MSDNLLCDRCEATVADPENPPMIANSTLCQECHDMICGNCLRIIPDSEHRYDIPPVGPGTTCAVCTARYVQWLCRRCGEEIHEETEQHRVDLKTEYDGTYCEDCVDEAFQRAKEAQEPPKKDKAPF